MQHLSVFYEPRRESLEQQLRAYVWKSSEKQGWSLECGKEKVTRDTSKLQATVLFWTLVDC